jgi:putative membrane protein
MSPVRPTDTLANERTFLAYARTALAFIGFGFVIARFSLFARELEAFSPSHPGPSITASAFGTAMALAGMVCGAYGAYRYVVTARALRAGGNAPMPDASAISIAFAIGVIGAIVIVTLLAYR